MEQIKTSFLAFPDWLTAVVILIVWIVVGLFVKQLFFWNLKRISQKTKTQLDDFFIKAASFPITLVVVVTGVWFVSQYFLNQPEYSGLTKYSSHFIKLGFIFSGIIFVDKILRYLISGYADKNDALRVAQGMVGGIARIFVIGIGALILLDSFGVSITPIIASLGIGSLAVALALQPTLENFFSGVQIIMDQPIIPGQFIKLESGEEGYVEKVGWRSTWVRQLQNNMVIIPNKQIVNSRILNYYVPSQDLAVLMQVGVHYNSDLKKVETVTIDVAKQIMKSVKGGVSDFDPFIRYHTFDSSSINFSVIMRAREFADNFLIKHEFIKALSERYQKENINIPFPIMALNTEQEKANFQK